MSNAIAYAATAAPSQKFAANPLSDAYAARMPTGRSEKVRRVVRLARQVAGHESSVLILGESGTGKEVLARAIHDLSARRHGPFVAVNCGAIPAELLESELFGHEKGAFTGAVSLRRGRFEVAENGTLFLDEIGDMSLPMQVKLLRVLQERQFERVGNHATLQCNVRIIAATHRNLEAAIESGQFRSDLYYRINVFPIDVPPLRQRLEDLGALIEDFVRQNCAAGRAQLQFSAAARSALEKYPWPGNIRELGNLIERLSITHAGSEIDVADLPPRYRPVEPDTVAAAAAPAATELPIEDDSQLFAQAVLGPPAMLSQPPLLPNDGFDLRAHIDSLEREFISQALQRSGGVVAHAARLLGLRRTTLVEKLRKLDGGEPLPPEV